MSTSELSAELEDQIEAVRHAIDAGAAVCLLGAGFSFGAKNATGNSIPSTSELTEELKTLFSIPETEQVSLSEVAEFANESPSTRLKLVTHLIKRLTSCVPSMHHSSFLSKKWRAIFTTNFDDLAEQGSTNKNRVAITPNTVAGSISPHVTPIYYMHGRALDVRESDTDPALVISESNYLKLEQRNRDLYARFFNEIVCAKAIVIIGYTLRDLEVASGLLNAGNEVKSKTIIVVGENESEFAKSRTREVWHGDCVRTLWLSKSL